MFAQDYIQAQGVVVEAISAEAYRLELANGHACVGRIAKELQNNFTSFLPGDKVLIAFQPYDLSRGRIIFPSIEPA